MSNLLSAWFRLSHKMGSKTIIYFLGPTAETEKGWLRHEKEKNDNYSSHHFSFSISTKTGVSSRQVFNYLFVFLFPMLGTFLDQLELLIYALFSPLP